MENQFTCLRENTEKYINFSVPIEKEVTRIDKNALEIIKTICYRLQFVDSARFMASSLSNLANNLAEGIHKIKCKYGHTDKNYETCIIKYKDCYCFLEYTNVKDGLIEYKCLCCNSDYQKTFDENLKKQFFNTHKFSNRDINKFILLLQEGVYPYEYMDEWEKFNETSVPEKEDFYNHLNMEDITDTYCRYAECICKNFEIKNLGEYHDLYVQSCILADVFENF